MKKLKVWQVILLIIFYPVGLIYLIYWFVKRNKPTATVSSPMKRNKSTPAVNVPIQFDVSAKTTTQYVELKQKTPGALPRLELGGYRNPSGGYLNFARYTVIGINPETNRKNTKIYNAKDENSAINKAKNDGLIEPFSIELNSHGKPSDRQSAYALDLGATLPDDVCSEDVSAIISRITDDDEASPSEGLGLFADSKGLYFSMYIGAGALLANTSRSLKGLDKIAFYVYTVHLNCVNSVIANMDDNPHKDKYYELASSVENDSSFLKSLDNIIFGQVTDIKKTTAYRTVFDFLKNNSLVK